MLVNPTLEDARLAASFDNNGAYGAVHIPPGWSFVYRVGDTLHMLTLPKQGEFPVELAERPPQVHPTDDFEGTLYLETSSYAGLAGFRQRVQVDAGRHYLAGIWMNAFVVANEPANGAVRCKVRIHHREGVAEDDWFTVPADHYGRPLEILTPLIAPVHSGEIGYEFLAEIRWPLVSVKFYLYQLGLIEVAQGNGRPARVTPFRTGHPGATMRPPTG